MPDPTDSSYPPDASTSRQRSLQRVRTLSYWLDNAIAVPGTGFRFGLDPIIGLLPGGGDTLTGLLSAYVLWEAAMMGLPRSTMLRMAGNVLLEVIVGTVPVIGDLFDFGWKANARNVRLLEKRLANPRTGRRRDRGFAIFLILVILAVIVAMIGVSIWLLSAIFGLFLN
jgi:hypothetical protein